MAFWIGLYPKPFFEILDQPVRQIVETVRPGYFNPNAAVNAQAAPGKVSNGPEAVIRKEGSAR
jgi:hypothetical protein